MDKFKKYVENQLDKVKRSASHLVADKPGSDGQEEDASIELDPQDFERLKNKAARERTTVQALINRAIHNLLNESQGGGNIHVTEEQKRRNPLLCLDGMTRRTDFGLGVAAVHGSGMEEEEDERQ
ncbi:Uncharacterised protein [Chlamydia abortus]|uniref:Uncharacterized protein n=1 Tax=Paenibacillus residui TaxID=629724 RepID=A0ABW3DEP0_9BACL|nr:hypothetical protein [Paenibacillus sp. 32O-W]SHE12856.1 Uncharacterised protein [Chlamydia abortus]